MEEEIHTIEEDAIITGVASINGQTGDLNLKTVNGNELLGTGNIEIQAGVTSVNGDTGDVTITASGIGAASSSDLQTLANTVAGKQNALTIDQMAAVNSGIDSTKVGQIATNTQGISDEITARQNADVGLQNQIDGLAASSDVTDIVGTKAALNAYDTSKLNNNDIVKVLQDESQNGETTYYRWSTSTQTFTLIGEEGPYYTKSQTDTLLNAKQDDLVAGTNITIAADGKTISATDTTYTAGTNVSISSGNVISATDTTYSNFVGTDGTAAGSAGLVPAPATTDADKFLKSDGTWEGINSGPTVVQTTGTSTIDVMSQNATTGMVYQNTTSKNGIWISPNAYDKTSDLANGCVSIGNFSGSGNNQNGGNFNARNCVVIGTNARAANDDVIAIGQGASSSRASAIVIGRNASALADNMIAIGENSGGSANGMDTISIGKYAYGTGSYSINIGESASTNNNGGIAIGAYSHSSAKGEMNIGTSQQWLGYNSTNYRLISGVHDGQGLHDAATVAQGNTLSTTAPTTATVGVLGQLYTDTTNMHTYQCTAISGDTYTWTQRW